MLPNCWIGEPLYPLPLAITDKKIQLKTIKVSAIVLVAFVRFTLQTFLIEAPLLVTIGTLSQKNRALQLNNYGFLINKVALNGMYLSLSLEVPWLKGGPFEMLNWSFNLEACNMGEIYK